MARLYEFSLWPAQLRYGHLKLSDRSQKLDQYPGRRTTKLRNRFAGSKWSKHGKKKKRYYFLSFSVIPKKILDHALFKKTEAQVRIQSHILFCS